MAREEVSEMLDQLDLKVHRVVQVLEELLEASVHLEVLDSLANKVQLERLAALEFRVPQDSLEDLVSLDRMDRVVQLVHRVWLVSQDRKVL